MDSTAFTIWDPSQPNAKMKFINIPGQGPAQLIETVSNMSGASTSSQAEQIILQTHDGQEFLVDENEIGQIDQIPPENLIYMAADDGSFIQGEVVHVQSDDIHQVIQQDQEYMECEVTEEVITDDWVQTDGQECVQVTVDQLGATAIVGTAEDDLAVPLPTDQDEYTTSRPYPCDFCRRRFRKKANLMNHIIAHSNDRPHVCNLCGAQYTRRSDLLNHLKLHAYVPDDHEEPMRNDPGEYEYDLSGSPSPDLQRRSFSEDEDDLLIPVPTQFMAPPPAPTPRVPKKPRTKPSGSSARSNKKASTSRSRLSHAQRHQETKFNPSVEHFVNLPPRFPVLDDRKPFVCQKCGVSFAREKALASHARIHGGDSPFDCETCGHRFWDRVMLQEHIRQRHAANLVAAPAEHSGVSSVMTTTQNEADQASSNEEEVEGQYYCDSCGTMFQRREQLKRHIKQVHAVREQKYEPISQIVRQRQQHQQQRQEEDDKEEEEEGEETETQYEEETESQQPLSCNVCGDTFMEALDLLAHAEVHARFEPYKCQLCRETFLDENAIKEHVQKQHSQELTDTSCVVCGKLCKNHAALLKHAWEHSRERTKLFGSHCCSKCGKTFHNKARLKRHMVSHRNKSVRCEICQEEFPDGRSLMNHRHSHTKTRQFPCHECGKTFGSRSSQQIHLRIHSGERPYGCRFCWKAFADGGTLRKHERVHTGEKPYGCSVCPRAFNQRVVLREHIRSHHSAPDSKRGTATQPYFCSVCAQLFETSMELIQHLIQHSDMNTAMKRQPPTYPRKYKRRRKLKTEETEPMKYGSKGKRKETNITYVETEQRAVEDEDLLKNPAEILLEYGAGTSNRKLIASPKYINSYDLLASATAEHNKPSTVDDNGINLLSNIVVVTNPSTSTDRTFKFIKTESPQERGAGNHHPGSSSSGSRPRMIHTQKTRVAVNDGKRKTKTVITKDIKSHPEGASTPYSTLEFKRSKNRTVPTYREIPSDKISSESFPLLDDGREDDGDGDEQSDSNQDALDALSSSNSQRHKQEVPNYEDLLNQNLLMEISRKDKYIDKYNSDIVNDLEEILRSPIKTTNNNVPPSRASHYSEQNDDDDYDEPDDHPRKASRKQHLKKISKETAQQSLTSALRSQRLTRRQLEREVNFLREAYTPDPTNSALRIKVEKGSPDKLSAMLLNDIQTSSSASSSMAAALISAKQEPTAPVVPVHIFQCEMCSAVFNERSQLLLHVPIHI